jgi:hypothetical protein
MKFTLSFLPVRSLKIKQIFENIFFSSSYYRAAKFIFLMHHYFFGEEKEGIFVQTCLHTDNCRCINRERNVPSRQSQSTLFCDIYDSLNGQF